MREYTFQSNIDVSSVDVLAADSMVVTAAKVSTRGQDSGLSHEQKDDRYKFINFLMKNRHGSPFEHNSFIFSVHAPIFVWREHMRHRIGFSYNEESGRYKQLEPVFYMPASNRAFVQEGKPGAYVFVPGDEFQLETVYTSIRDANHIAYENYTIMLKAGIAREVARMVLPVNIYSTAYVTMNARSLMSFLSLRTKSDQSTFPSYPQREIEMVAEQYEKVFQEWMPLTYRAFCENGRVAP